MDIKRHIKTAGMLLLCLATFVGICYVAINWAQHMVLGIMAAAGVGGLGMLYAIIYQTMGGVK